MVFVRIIIKINIVEYFKAQVIYAFVFSIFRPYTSVIYKTVPVPDVFIVST